MKSSKLIKMLIVWFLFVFAFMFLSGPGMAAGPDLAPASALDISAILAAFWGRVEIQLYVAIFMTLLDLIFGVILAVRQKRFSWDHLNDYLDKNIIPILIWLAVAALSMLPTQTIPDGITFLAPEVVYYGILAHIGQSLLSHFSAFGVGTNMLSKASILPTGAPEPCADGSPGGGE
jgi:hypothetical protein